MLATATLGGVEVGLRPMNIIMATLLFAVAIPVFDKWLQEVRADE